ncbi:aminopeptidase [Alicyclobacillus sp. SO9]|uniref:aminopeptidase n=1 Tax=Alicyclobacillus sp. SO9 TaxID=2665646 RepID=UPI0018E778DA|nr:aminopeptidase [Alicyclobacillus sp. SO9]QQE78887.1 aminopeptidase [Alicyclobacillus sp. SO9]
MSTLQELQEKYAELILTVGLNLQPGQPVLLECPLELVDYGRTLARKAYEIGAGRVHVEWIDEEIRLITLEHSKAEYLDKSYYWRAKMMESFHEEGGALLQVYAPNPDLLKDVDPQRAASLQKSSAVAMNNFRNKIQNGQINWCLTSAPTKEWAKKVYPELNEEEGMKRLWDQIFYMTRANQDNPIGAWEQHLATLKEKVETLNEKKFKSLHYTTSEGTDLTIELPEGHIWLGGGWDPKGQIPFVPNIPTEEVFTMPHREGVNGVVKATLPLNYNGTLIENFSLTFKKGRIVDFSAEAGYDTLKTLIETDDGAHYLGEVALVPYDSPISNLHQIFFNTLFDENASCHLAIGAAYPTTIEGGTDLSREQLLEKGANNSLQHVDFMVGSATLNIDGMLQSGETIPVFRDGNWAL